MKRVLLFVGMLLGCSSKPVAEQGASETVSPAVRPARPPRVTELLPRWRVGDSWIVRYHYETPSQRNRDAPNDVFEIEWVYRVDAIAAGGVVEISATYLRFLPGLGMGTDDLWRARRTRFGPAADILSIDGEWATLPPVLNPYFPVGGYLEPIAHEWPLFPLRSDSVVELEAGFEQRVESHEGGGLLVFLTRDKTDAVSGAVEYTKTMEQEWEHGRPWWSTHRMRVHGEGYGPEGITVLEGRVVSWEAPQGIESDAKGPHHPGG